MVEVFFDAEFFPILANQPFFTAGIAVICHLGVTPLVDSRSFAGTL
jgi:hypothetical protein